MTEPISEIVTAEDNFTLSHEMLTVLRSKLPLYEIVKFCQTNKTAEQLCNVPNFWTSWFKENGARLPEDFTGLNFRQTIEKIWQELLICNPPILHEVFTSFISNPKFLFRGLERFIGFPTSMANAVHWNDDSMIDYLVNKLNSMATIPYFDYFTIRLLIETNKPDILRRLVGYKFPIPVQNLNSIERYVMMQIVQTLGQKGNGEMYDLITARFFKFSIDYIFLIQVFAHYTGNIKFAQELNNVDSRLINYRPDLVARKLHWLNAGAHGTILPIALLETQLHSYFIGLVGLFPALDRIMNHNLAFPQSTFNLHIGTIVSMAMNSNNYDFMTQFLSAPWYDPNTLWTELNNNRMPILFADTYMWDLLISRVPQLQNMLRNDKQIQNVSEPMSDVWLGNRIDVLCHLQFLFGPIQNTLGPFGSFGTILNYSIYFR